MHDQLGSMPSFDDGKPGFLEPLPKVPFRHRRPDALVLQPEFETHIGGSQRGGGRGLRCIAAVIHPTGK